MSAYWLKTASSRIRKLSLTLAVRLSACPPMMALSWALPPEKVTYTLLGRSLTVKLSVYSMGLNLSSMISFVW